MVPHRKRQEYSLEREIEEEVEAVLHGNDDIDMDFGYEDSQ